jgi:hypothetical protein
MILACTTYESESILLLKSFVKFEYLLKEEQIPGEKRYYRRRPIDT